MDDTPLNVLYTTLFQCKTKTDIAKHCQMELKLDTEITLHPSFNVTYNNTHCTR